MQDERIPVSNGERPQVNADDAQFFDFFYPRDPIHPYGVYERDVPARYVQAIDEIAARWSKTSSPVEEERWHGRHRDCQIASDWAAALCRLDVPSVCVGELGDDETTKCQSGYRIKTGAIICHFWVVIGTEQLIFDPTSSQFHYGGVCQIVEPVDKGGVSVDRYVVDGWSFRDARLAGVRWVEPESM
jgi:hypothetical protein